MSFGKRVARALARRFLGKTGQFVAPTNIFVGLSSTNPATDGQSQTEPSTGAYARQSTDETDWTDPTDADPSAWDNSSAITYPTATADYLAGANITYVTFWDHLTSTTEANFLGAGLLTVAKPVLDTDIASFPIGTLDFTLT